MRPVRHLSRIIPTAMRRAEVSRNTLETQITVRLNLDGTGAANLNTGLGFNGAL